MNGDQQKENDVKTVFMYEIVKIFNLCGLFLLFFVAYIFE